MDIAVILVRISRGARICNSECGLTTMMGGFKPKQQLAMAAERFYFCDPCKKGRLPMDLILKNMSTSQTSPLGIQLKIEIPVLNVLGINIVGV